MIRTIAFAGMAIFGILTIIVAGFAVYAGVDLANGLDKAACIDMVVSDIDISTGSDGFVGNRNHYFILSENKTRYELLTSGNKTTVREWMDIRNGRSIQIKTYGGYFMFCSQPKLIPDIPDPTESVPVRIERTPSVPNVALTGDTS